MNNAVVNPTVTFALEVVKCVLVTVISHQIIDEFFSQ